MGEPDDGLAAIAASEAKIRAITQKITRLKEKIARFEDLNILFTHSGGIDHFNWRIRALEDKIADAESAIRIRRSTIAAGDDPYGVPDPDHDPGPDAVGFDDPRFVKPFTKSLEFWALSGRTSALEVWNAIRKEPNTAGIAWSQVASVVAAVLKKATPHGRSAGIAETVATIISGYEKSNAALGKTAKAAPKSVKRMLQEVGDAFIAIQENPCEQYWIFVAEWKRMNRIPPAVETVDPARFLPVCEDYANQHLPDTVAMKQAMLAEILKLLRDDEYLDSDNDGSKAGYVHVRMSIWFCHGEYEPRVKSVTLDDTPKALREEVKRQFEMSGIKDVIDLPIPVRFSVTVESHEGSGTLREFNDWWRKSDRPGDTRMVFGSGRRGDVFRRFLAEQSYRIPKLAQMR